MHALYPLGGRQETVSADARRESASARVMLVGVRAAVADVSRSPPGPTSKLAKPGERDLGCGR